MKSVQNSLLTVVLPVYNAQEFVRPSVESILDQTYTDFDFIIIDNCSTDASFDILREYVEKDDRVCLHRNDRNMGFVYSLNKGNQLATTEYVARMDADDVCTPDRLEKQIRFLLENPEIDVVTCWNGQFDTDPGVVWFTI